MKSRSQHTGRSARAKSRAAVPETVPAGGDGSGDSSLIPKDEETLSQQVLVALRREILSGSLAPGSRLVRRTIAKRFGVSTLPVVEALYRLEMEGLVENIPHAGAKVVDPETAVMEGDRIVREAIECQVARLLAEMGGRAPLAELVARAELLDEIEHDADAVDPRAGDTYLFAHFNFHLALAEATGWKVLAAHLQGIWFRRIMVSIAENKSWYEVPPHWHRQLVEAIETGDPDVAEQKMREHVRHSRDRYRLSLKESLRRDQEEWLAKIAQLTGGGSRVGRENS